MRFYIVFLISVLWAGSAFSGRDEHHFDFSVPDFPVFTGGEDFWEIGQQMSFESAVIDEYVFTGCNKSPTVTASIHNGKDTGVDLSMGGYTFDVYESGVAGIGFVVGVKDSNGDSWVPVGLTPLQVYPAPGAPVNKTSIGMRVKLWYVATQALKPGSYNIPRKAVVRFDAQSSSPDQAYMYHPAKTLKVATTGCTLIDSEINVGLGRVESRENFKGVGSSSPAKNFTIPIDCDGVVAIDMVVTSSNVIDSATGVIGLAPGGAEGVGIQLLREDGSTPIQLEQNVRMSAGTVSGRNDLNLSARYYQVADKVSPGVAAAVANIQLKYK